MNKIIFAAKEQYISQETYKLMEVDVIVTVDLEEIPSSIISTEQHPLSEPKEVKY